MSKLRIPGRKEPLRIGFVPATDCAPVVCAHEAGLFSKYDLNVELQRELSWANIRDKIIDGELDAAHAPATLPFMANIATEEDPCLCVSGMVLSLQGNAITVSQQLFGEGVTNAETLREYVFKTWGKKTCTFAVGALWSTQSILLRQWLESGAMNPESHIRIVTIPPEQLFPTLKLGYIDGYCASEPWTSVAVQSGHGVCLATSTDLAPMHPEKVLVVRNSFATGRPDEHERMLAALLEACQFCDQPKNRPFLVNMLSHPRYANAPEEALSAALIGPFSMGHRNSGNWT